MQEEFENLSEAAAAALGGAKASDLKVPNSTQGHCHDVGKSSNPYDASAAKINCNGSGDLLLPVDTLTAEGNSSGRANSARPSDSSAGEGNNCGCGDTTRPSDASAANTTAAGGGFDVLSGELIIIPTFEMKMQAQ